MKTMKFLVAVGLALLISVPRVNAQNKRAERKLEREMRKLEKQLDKVRDLQGNTYVPMLEEMKRAQEEVERARAEADLQYKEQQQIIKEELERAFELQRHEMEQLKDQYPDGIYFKGPELPEFDFHIPDIDLELPEITIPDQEWKLPSHGMYFSGVYDGDNKLSINSKLEDETIEKSYDYTVADDASFIDIKASGAMKEGSVNVKIMSPDNKEYQSLDLTNMADVDWSKRIDLKEKDRENLKGKWTIKVKGENATGLYKITLRSR